VIALGAAFEYVLAVLHRLEIPFLVGGSVASSTHGLPRQTNDIDIVADLTPSQVKDFCESLQPAFYVDPAVVAEAIELERPFNVIHLQGAYKFDIFPVGQDQFAQSELARRRYTTTTITGLENVEFPVASPEDIILAKLSWFRQGGQISDWQWHDVLGVVQIQAGRLDSAYLQQWAAELGVSGLLNRALLGQHFGPADL